ncbi:MAG TPA: hypothetical protein VF937_03375 [Chloroflexota bacterium]
MLFTPGLEQLDPALLAFVKCHVTSSVKWEVLRTLAYHDGAWVRADQMAHGTHRHPSDIARAVAELANDGVVEVLPSDAAGEATCRLPADEPTSVVLHRLIEATTHSQEMREIIAAHLQHVRQQAAQAVGAPGAA